MKSILFATLFALCPLTATINGAENSDLRLAKIFTDNMVLQQQKPIAVWGWAKPGTKVSITLTQNPQLGEKAVTTYREQAQRPSAALRAIGEYSIKIQYVEKNPPRLPTQIHHILSDESGRWNVRFQAAPASFQPTWIIASSDDAVVVVQNVLIGEIWVCAGQSNMGWGGFNRKDREAASADFPGLRYIAWEDSYYKPLDDVRRNIHWQECSPETAERFSAIPYLYGMFLHRYLKVPVGVINVARGGTLGQTWCLRDELTNIDNPIIKKVLADYDAETAAWDDPQQLAAIMAQWENSVESAKVEHQQRVAKAKAAGKPEPRLRLPKKPADPRSGWSPPAGLFNATIMPIRHLGIRGVLYYQGENNNFMRWTRYESTFPKVPVSFRQAFGEKDLPFGCISQPGWGTFGLDPELATVAEGYAIIRDIQRRALANDPHGDMIATYPTGNSYIHPAEKLPVAEYASLWALAKVYQKPVQHVGNTYREMKVKDNKLYLFFDIDPIVRERWKNVTKQAYWQVLPCPREGKAEFKGFIIAGKDQRWYPAKGRHTKLDDNWCIELTSDLVSEPAAARYGWANWPTGNMVGRNRIPMPTFRTDNWPIPAGVNYSKDAQDKSKQQLDQLRQVAQRQALDRKIRQAQVDLPRLETELYKGNAKGQIQSKLARVEAILTEMQTDKWLSNRIRGDHPELAKSIKALQETIAALKAQADAIPDK
jgi:sialate O-acetylesterase